MMSILLELLHFYMLMCRLVVLELFYFVFRNRPRKEIKNSHILITGTGLGIGNCLVSELAKDGNILHCVDLSASLNEELVEKYGGRDCTLHTYVCDISNVEQLQNLLTKVRSKCGEGKHIDYLINNAGTVCGKLFTDTSIQAYTRVLNVNILAHMNMCKLFLPGMLEHGGHIVNIASVAGILVGPYMVDYCTSKHAAVGFSRGLQCELEWLGKDNVKITTIFPHFTNTGMFHGATVKIPALFPMLQPEYVAEKIVTGIKEEVEELVLPRLTPGVFVFRYILGSRLFRTFCSLLGNDLMKTFRKIRED